MSKLIGAITSIFFVILFMSFQNCEQSTLPATQASKNISTQQATSCDLEFSPKSFTSDQIDPINLKWNFTNASKVKLACDNNIGVPSIPLKPETQEISLPQDTTECILTVTDKDGKTQDCSASLTLKTNTPTCRINYKTLSVSSLSSKITVSWNLYNLTEGRLTCGTLIDQVIGDTGNIEIDLTETTNCFINADNTAQNLCAATLTYTPPPQVAPQILNGTCGSSNGQTLTSSPTNGLCNSGSPSSVSGNGPYTWKCSGLNGGTDQTCSANSSIVVGVCGSANGGQFTSTPTTNLCASGTPTSMSGTTSYTWKCEGANGGITAACSASKIVIVVVTDGACGPANGATYNAIAPSVGLCNSGTPSAVTSKDYYGLIGGSTTNWIWTCSGDGGGKIVECKSGGRYNFCWSCMGM